MNNNEVTELISNIINIKDDYDTFFWVGTGGVFNNGENPNPRDELICCCGVSYTKETGNWIVTPWIYNNDCPAVFKSAQSARAYFFFWLNWITSLYGDDIEEPDFEADWLSIKSNRSVIMMLYDIQAEKFKTELWQKEKEENINEHI